MYRIMMRSYAVLCYFNIVYHKISAIAILPIKIFGRDTPVKI